MAIANEIETLKTNITNAYTSISTKGGTIPTNKNTENLSSAIESIPSGGEDGWQRPDDWWDTKSILQNAENIELDGVTYYPRYIMLLRNTTDTTTALFNNTFSAKVVKFSDNTTMKLGVMSGTTNISHSWDTTYDKECSLGYKTRYILFYDDSLTSVCSPNLLEGVSNNCVLYSALELIYGFGKFEAPKLSSQSGSSYKKVTCLQNFETFDDVDFETYTVTQSSFRQSIYSLLNINLPTVKNIVKGDTYSTFSLAKALSINMPLLETATIFSLPNYLEKLSLPKFTGNSVENNTMIYNFSEMLVLNLPQWSGGSINLDYSYDCEEVNLPNFSLNSSTNLSFNSFTLNNTQYHIKKLVLKEWHKNFDISALTSLEKTYLLDILNKMADVTSETTTYTATFGTNKNKLSEEELAIATGKGWTIK